ncbi:hypothetical protein OG203_31345 [Nocardia sp. NBC_01499]|uniref:AAA family ATPase n=1 Tax=Nocardia sp. NBC_01499 TaxID=2903597 RepID=UPI0038670740
MANASGVQAPWPQEIDRKDDTIHSHRLLVTGASGVGTTTLGRALASLQSVPHADVDDYFWIATSPPYTYKRPIEDRLALMNSLFLPRDAWILSGSLMGWGDSLIKMFDGVVFLTVDPHARMDRLMNREVLRYGDTIEQGGFNEAAHHEFMDWARGYDDANFSGRSRAQHERWLTELPCPVLRLDSAESVPELISAVTDWLRNDVSCDNRNS